MTDPGEPPKLRKLTKTENTLMLARCEARDCPVYDRGVRVGFCPLVYCQARDRAVFEKCLAEFMAERTTGTPGSGRSG